MYGIFTYIYHKNQPNVGKYTIHGSYGINRTMTSIQHVDNKKPLRSLRRWRRLYRAPLRVLGSRLRTCWEAFEVKWKKLLPE